MTFVRGLSRRRGGPISFAAVLLIAALISILLSSDRVTHVAAGTAANEFSMSVDIDGDTTADCDTSGGSTTCTVGPDPAFTLVVSLDAINLPDNNGNTTTGYVGFQVRVDNTAGINQVDTTGAGEVLWPDSSLPVEARSASEVVIGGATSGSESTFLGDVIALDYICKSSGTLTMIHDAAVGTNIVDDFGNSIADDTDGASELLTLNCPQPVGGIAELVAAPVDAGGSSGDSGGVVTSVVWAVAATVIVLGGAAWYARRRLL